MTIHDHPLKIVYKGHVFIQQNESDNRYYRCWERQKGWYGKRLHQLVWIEHHGPVPKGFCVHHINGDKLDNRIENLELVPHSDHIRKHKIWETQQ